jgi:hypothetical protein
VTAARDETLLAVRDAALERALVEAADSRAYLALAGTLERVRKEGAPVEGRQPQSSASEPLATVLTCLVSVTAHSERRRDHPASTPSSAWSPDGDTDVVATGAVLALRTFDVDVATVAARAGLSRADLRARYRAEKRVPE